MSVTYRNSSLSDLKVDLILDAINNAEFTANDYISKNAVSKGQVSRFSDKALEYAAKDQRVTATLVVDVGELPVKEARFVADALDKFGDQKGGKIKLSENVIKDDFDPVAVRERICKYAVGKVERSLKEHGVGLDTPSLPQQSTIAVNTQAKTGLLNWIKQGITGKQHSPSPSP